MHHEAYIKISTRENLVDDLPRFKKSNCQLVGTNELHSLEIPTRGAILGKWANYGDDSLPDFIILRKEDLNDTLAWITSFFAPLTPITQWCRIWTSDGISKIDNTVPAVKLNGTLGPWIGAILAECQAQASTSLNLRELSGVLALTSGTFVAARTSAVWNDNALLEENARKYDDLSSRLRDSARHLSAKSLLPLFLCLSSSDNSQEIILEPFTELFRTKNIDNKTLPELLLQYAGHISAEFNIPNLLYCAQGPQNERLKYFDIIAKDLLNHPKSKATDALLGFCASLIEPGTPVLPDLLRPYIQSCPTAPVWLGAFAGLWSLENVINGYGGLGRLIAKALLAESDIFSKPSCDIAYNEIIRWVGTNNTKNKVLIRGMGIRMLMIELCPGVTSGFAYSSHTVESQVKIKTYYADPHPSNKIGRLEKQITNQQNDINRMAKTIADIGEKFVKVLPSNIYTKDNTPLIKEPDLFENSPKIIKPGKGKKKTKRQPK